MSPAAPATPDRASCEPNRHLDADHPRIVALAAELGGDDPDPRAVAVRLFHAVRDRLRYNPWQVALTDEGYRASEIATRDVQRGGHCIDKAMLLAALARARGIPARLHFADVRNHIGTAKLERLLGTDRLVYHGYAELWLGQRWVAATPAFDAPLCHRLGVEPLSFDGERDAVFDHGAGGRRFMEYLEDHGSWAEVPVAAMVEAWRRHYPAVRAGKWPSPVPLGDASDADAGEQVSGGAVMGGPGRIA